MTDRVLVVIVQSAKNFPTEVAESGTVLQVVNARTIRDSPLTPIERDVSSPRKKLGLRRFNDTNFIG